MFDEKPKNEDKPKNEEIRAELSMWRGLAVLLGILVVCLIAIFFVIPHLFPPAVEIVKYCGDVPCEQQGITLKDSVMGISIFVETVKPFLAVGLGLGLASGFAGMLLRMIGGIK